MRAFSHFLKEEREVQWTPHSVTVLTREELESGFKRDLEDIESIVPGLIVDRMNTTPRGAAIALRGLGSSGASKAFDPAVAVNIDGVYVGTHTNRLQVLFDFEQIEVVRSPNTRVTPILQAPSILSVPNQPASWMLMSGPAWVLMIAGKWTL